MTISKEAVELREAYGYAIRFLKAFCESHSLRQVEPLPTLCGVLTQIDNATTALRPAPSQSDESLLNGILGLTKMYKTLGTAAQHEDAALIAAAIKQKIDTHMASVRAEATLAGAAAEREWNKPNIDAIREAKDEDLRTLRAAKDREIASFAGERLAYCTRIAALREALTLANQFLHPGNVELGAQMKIDAALAGSPAPDHVEAMRAKCEAIAREHEQKAREAALINRQCGADVVADGWLEQKIAAIYICLADRRPQGQWRWAVSEPSVEEIVAHMERHSYRPEYVAALIADWRKRGEALKAAEPILAARSGWCGDDNDEVFPVLLKVRDALTPQPRAKP